MNMINDMYRKVVCLNDEMIFDNLKYASEYFGADELDIVYTCKGISKYCKGHNNKKLTWRFYEDFLNMDNTDKEKILKDIEEDLTEFENKVICLNTNRIYTDLDEASLDTNIPTRNIRQCCNNRIKYSFSKDRKKLVFMYLMDYIKLSKDDKSNILMSTTAKNNIPVFCLNLRKKFKNIEEASKCTGVSARSVQSNCKGQREFSQNKNNEKFVFMYWSKYLELNTKERQRLVNESLILVNKPVVCLNLDKKFDSINSASEELDIQISNIEKCCKSSSSFVRNRKGDKFIFMYYKDYLTLGNKTKKDKVKESKIKCLNKNSQIICLNTEEVFDNVELASKELNLSENSINKCCMKPGRFASRKDGKRFVFMYYTEYLLLNSKERKKMLNEANKKILKKVVNVETGDVYESAHEASEETSISEFTIRQQCNKKEFYSKTAFKEGPAWLYLEDYIKRKRRGKILIKENSLSQDNIVDEENLSNKDEGENLKSFEIAVAN